ncbi:hypothetical protein ON010_g18977 [Phytophthora cinnamomi]|nr:hypothetical protein ON010_g18977 [Phytophthora cinnamomi]
MDDDTDPDGVMFEVGEWRDTLPLFSGGVQIRFTPRDYMMGHIFAHCHIASHVDGGMAQLVRVYNPEEDNGDDNEFGAGSTADEEEGSDGSSDTDEDEDDEDDSGSDENGSDEAEEEGDEEEGEEEGKP